MTALAKDLIQQALNAQFVGGAIKRENWFSWPVAILIMFTGASVVVMVRLARWLPRLAPQLARKLGLRQSAEEIQQQFFKRCMRLLKRAGFVRGSSQTVQEYTGLAGDKLLQANLWRNAPRQLDLLTQAYYQVRFGNNKVLEPEAVEQISSALQELEESVSRKRTT